MSPEKKISVSIGIAGWRWLSLKRMCLRDGLVEKWLFGISVCGVTFWISFS